MGFAPIEVTWLLDRPHFASDDTFGAFIPGRALRLISIALNHNTGVVAALVRDTPDCRKCHDPDGGRFKLTEICSNCTIVGDEGGVAVAFFASVLSIGDSLND